MSKNNKRIASKTRIQIVLLVIGLLCSLFFKTPAAAISTITPAVSSNCSSSSSAAYYDALSQPISGGIYIKLPAGTSPTLVSLYSESSSYTSCQRIGAAKAEPNHWTFLGNSTPVTNIMIVGSGLEVEPYAAVADLLALPSAATCIVNTVCSSTYQGYVATLLPNLISNNTDQIAVYQASSIIDVKYSSINYYSDGIFLYSSPQVRPINHDYLGGGTHAITITISFINGEKLNINQTVNMGADWSGVLRIRSDFYRSHNKFVFGGVMFCVVVVLILLLWLGRILYKRREFKVDHGLSDYESPDVINPEDDQDDNHPVIG